MLQTLTMHCDKKLKISQDAASTASYVQFGSFTVPYQPQGSRNPKTFAAKERSPQDDKITVDVLEQNQVSKPLHACPGLPKPNQEMKYHSWERGSVRHSSGINLSKMTHYDHSEDQKHQTEPPKASTPEVEEESKTAVDDDDELNAVITLSSYFKTGLEKNSGIASMSSSEAASKPQSRAIY